MDEAPAVIDVGLAEIVTVGGAALPATVTVAVADAVWPLPEAVAV